MVDVSRKMARIQQGNLGENTLFSGSCQETDSNRDFYSPDSGKTRINFPVPSDQVIQNYVNNSLRVPSNLQPGVIKDQLKAIPDDVKEKEKFVVPSMMSIENVK